MSASKNIEIVDGEEIEAARGQTARQTDRKCPACNGILAFDPGTQNMKCPYCDSEFSIKELEATAPSLAGASSSPSDDGKRSKRKSISDKPKSDRKMTKEEERKANLAAKANASKRHHRKHSEAERPLRLDDETTSANCDWGTAKKVIVCKTCGASSVYDAVQTASACPYCESNHIIVQDDKQLIAPTGISPFSITQEQAIEKFKEWTKSLWFAPSDLNRVAVTNGLQGMYLPHWTFDVLVKAKYEMDYGIDEKRGEKYVTKWRHTSGSHEQFYDDYIMPACSKQNKKMLDAICPFNTEDYVDYRPEYLAGFIAERYSISVKDSWKQAEKEIKDDIKDDCCEKVKDYYDADHTRREKYNITMGEVSYKYLLLPVWHSSYRYGGTVYQYMVNGQNGKVSGKRPYSWWKIFFASLGCFGLLLLIMIILAPIGL